jgi:hypothetical protein
VIWWKAPGDYGLWSLSLEVREISARIGSPHPEPEDGVLHLLTGAHAMIPVTRGALIMCIEWSIFALEILPIQASGKKREVS